MKNKEIKPSQTIHIQIIKVVNDQRLAGCSSFLTINKFSKAEKKNYSLKIYKKELSITYQKFPINTPL